MDSMEVNKGIAAVLVAGITFFLTGMIADGLVHQTPLEKSVLKIQGAPAESTAASAPKPEQLPPVAPLLAKADVQTGDKFVHTVCAACHSFNEGGKPIIGPNLYNVVGGPHDHEAGFNYSPALEKFKGQPWTFEALNHWLHKPSEYAPGTRMTFAGIPSAQQRADVIAYLRTLSHKPVPLPAPEAAKPATPAATTPGGSSAGGGAAAQAPKAAAPSTAAPGAAKPPAGGSAAAPGAPAAPATKPPAGGSAAAPAAPAGGSGAAPAAQPAK